MIAGGIAAAGRRRLVLALSSGGTRGFAHLGVIKALIDAGLRIDGICGASAGALFGAIYAVDGRLESVLAGVTATPLEILALYRDRLRLAPSNPLGVRLAAHFGDARIESLAVPMSIVTVDIESGEEVLLREGSLLAALEASIAIPLLARPVDLEGRYLIDGGYSGVSPAHGARAMNADVVVEVNLGARRRLPRRLSRVATGAMAGLRAGRAKFGSPRRLALAIATLLTRDPEPSAHADLLIEPELSDIVPHSPFMAAEAFRRGEEAALRALPAVRRLLAPSQPAIS